MKFYVYTFTLAFIQTFLLIPLFSGYLYTPDFVTVAILYTLLKERVSVNKVLIPAFTLDLFYDSLGLNISSKLLVFFIVIIFKRYMISTRKVTIPFSIMVFFTEHIFKYLLFRIKYYYPFEPTSLAVCLILETMATFLLSKRQISQNEQT